MYSVSGTEESHKSLTISLYLSVLRKWYVEFPLMCAGVLLLKTPANRYLSNKRPVYKLVTITSKT